MPAGLSTELHALLQAGEPVAYVQILSASGSTPREPGVAMLVTGRSALGTIGGGRLEWDAVERARLLLIAGEVQARLDVKLGSAIGQCCGGQVALAITRADTALLARVASAEREAASGRQAVLLFGAGHVGRALAHALAPLPLSVRWIDGREDEFGPAVPPAIETIATRNWEVEITGAPSGTSCLVVTHSHALDSLIVAAALQRDDFAYVGLIGSRTKRRQFEHGFRAIGMSESRIARLVCPIGGGFVRDKRPEVIAAFATAEMLQASLHWQAQRAGDTGQERAA